jgi:EpsI family protein
MVLIITALFVHGHRKNIRVHSSKDIADIPYVIGSFNGVSIPPSSATYHDPSADQWIQRSYVKNSSEIPINVYIGYWENQNESKRIKPPRYSEGRWEYYWTKTKKINIKYKKGNLRELLNERDDQKELVLYCYIVNGRIFSSEYYLRYLNMVNLLINNKSNAALLRISIPISEGLTVESAEMYGENFFKEILTILYEYI